MHPTICVCVNNSLQDPVSIVLKRLEGRVSAIVYGTDVSCFAPVKANNDGIILIVLGSCAHAVIKDLCDDYDKEQRRVKLIYSLSAGVDAYKLSELKQELSAVTQDGHEKVSWKSDHDGHDLVKKLEKELTEVLGTAFKL